MYSEKKQADGRPFLNSRGDKKRIDSGVHAFFSAEKYEL